ncbi:hypothetical protein [Roseateles chitinivorans]|uniref:hypothetical protein n=1 Tax=Roseateles chitinivorans TaxID=2917965 RepID=UPI003D677B71
MAFLRLHDQLRRLARDLRGSTPAPQPAGVAGLLGVDTRQAFTLATPPLAEHWSVADTLALLTAWHAPAVGEVDENWASFRLSAEATLYAAQSARLGQPFHIDIDLMRQVLGAQGPKVFADHVPRLLHELEHLSRRGLIGPLVAISRSQPASEPGWRSQDGVQVSDASVRSLLGVAPPALAAGRQPAQFETPMPGLQVMRHAAISYAQGSRGPKLDPHRRLISWMWLTPKNSLVTDCAGLRIQLSPTAAMPLSQLADDLDEWYLRTMPADLGDGTTRFLRRMVVDHDGHLYAAAADGSPAIRIAQRQADGRLREDVWGMAQVRSFLSQIGPGEDRFPRRWPTGSIS